MKTTDLQIIRQAFQALAALDEEQRNRILQNIAVIIDRDRSKIITANKKDVTLAIRNKLPTALVERLRLDDKGIDTLLLRLKAIWSLDSKLGQAIDTKILENGVSLSRIRVALGVIFIIYESRPEVTIDAAALCIKSGNAVILKGGKEAIETNTVLLECIQKALSINRIKHNFVSLIKTYDEVNWLLKQDDYIDLVIARGGYELVKTVKAKTKIPVLAHSAGGARIYVDKSANLDIVSDIVINAKTTKPSACNSVDCVLLHRDIAKKVIPKLASSLAKSGVRILGDEKVAKIVECKKAGREDWNKEFLDLILGIKIVNSLNEALAFINKYGKNHTEGIIAEDKSTIDKFVTSIDAAALFVNCSTRLHDGFVFGKGAEMGIATGKLHARGPVGLEELTTYKWVMKGSGQIRI